MACDCMDCRFQGMEFCERRRAMEEVHRLKKELDKARGTIQEAKDRMRYYFGEFGGGFLGNPQMQNVYDVLCRDDGEYAATGETIYHKSTKIDGNLQKRKIV